MACTGYKATSKKNGVAKHIAIELHFNNIQLMEPEVVTLADGLQYKIIVAGDGTSSPHCLTSLQEKQNPTVMLYK